jgi:hypothetical protein
MLGGLRGSLVTALAGGRDTHNLEPSADRESFVEDQPGEGPHFAWPGVMPYSGNDLGDRRVSEAERLDEGDDAGNMVLLLCVSVPPLGRIAEEGSVPDIARLLPVPISRIPFEFGDEAGFEYPIDWWFFSRGGECLWLS